ncbi:SDR family NAD(P)-dependent oxidoreductase [Hymenobacter sp. HMF4947]|uniref:SDR family NAD(P)-dependent oxidoreductase n=1 Tax=Hymenobacter ginkgonis TaxID=2682976 RepID=A0A7K1TG93_9BACT|nr:SDR family oxidoreductase [Hymenobacter ginkgonis]MVN77423.1 SDR family NAD(P)-dependent oxidoreductase [Hymenobacter ginkgonis]
MADSPKHALITGATSGIGRELAKLFAQDKYNLVIVARSQDELSQTAAELQQQYGVEVTTIAKDLFQRQAPFDVYDEIKAKGIQIDALVNDAGQGQYGEFKDTDINRELDIIQLNIGAYVTFTKLYLKEMLARNDGKILQVASIASELPGPLQAIYHATKAAVLSFTEAIQEETKDSKVTITALQPGLTDTDFFRKADMTQAKNVAEGNPASPADVAKDGYKALLAGDKKVVSGFMNKVQVAVSNIIPDSLVASKVHSESVPVNESK